MKFTKHILVLAAGFSLLTAPLVPAFADESVTSPSVEMTAPATDAPVADSSTSPSEEIIATSTPADAEAVATTTDTDAATTTPDVVVPDVATTTDDAQTVIVKFKDNALDLDTSAGKQVTQAIAANEDVHVEDTISSANIAVVSSQSGEDAQATADRLSDNPAVQYAEPNYARSISVINTDDTYDNELWALENTGQIINVQGVASGTPGADISATKAWTLSTGTSTIVAVIDSGVLYTHADLKNQMWDGTNCVSETGAALGGCNHGYDYHFDGTSDPTPLPDAPNPGSTPPITITQSTHGTHVAGIIAAQMNNDEGIVGVAPSTKIMAIKFGFDVASEVKAIDFATQNHAKIINASFSGPDSSQAEYDAIKRFTDAGGIFVTAAANSGTNNDVTPTYPGNYALPGIVTVAATDQNDHLASFSSYGATTVDLGAPGTNIMSTATVDGTSDSYLYLSGTSMATPMVAGAIALADSLYAATTSTAIISNLLSSGTPLPALAGKTLSGKRLNAFAFLNSLAAASVVGTTTATTTPDTTAPVITLNGDATTTVGFNGTYTELGATAFDNTDGTTTVAIGGDTVTTSTAGTYIVTYTATDTAGNTASTTRTVIVSAPPAPPAPVQSGGGGGGGGGGSSQTTIPTIPTSPKSTFPVATTTQVFQPIVTPAAPKVLGASSYIFTKNLKIGSTGSDVTELQNLLARLGFYHSGTTGYFGQATAAGLRAFQAAHGISQTGTVGPQTRAALNQGTDSAPATTATTTPAALQALIASLLAQLQALQAQAKLQAGH